MPFAVFWLRRTLVSYAVSWDASSSGHRGILRTGLGSKWEWTVTQNSQEGNRGLEPWELDKFITRQTQSQGPLLHSRRERKFIDKEQGTKSRGKKRASKHSVRWEGGEQGLPGGWLGVGRGKAAVQWSWGGMSGHVRLEVLGWDRSSAV